MKRFSILPQTLLIMLIISAIVTVLLFIYLLAALLRPEWF